MLFLNKRFTTLLFGLFALGPAKSFSNDQERELIQQQQEQLLKNEQLRQEHELNQLDRLTPPSDSTKSEVMGDDVGSRDNKDAPCITFYNIVVEGATLLSKAQTSTLLSPYQDQCLSAVKLTQLKADMTNHYIGEGYITTRVYFPKQDFTSGQLRVWVLEGKYESLEIHERDKDAPESLPSSKRSGFNTVINPSPDEVLNLRDLEQAIDQINRLSAYDAQMMIEPGDQEGMSKVKLYTKTSKPWSLSTSVSNSAPKVLGEYQTIYSARAEDVLGLYELWAFSYARELNADRWGRSYTGYVSLPYEYWTLNLSTSLYDYKTPVKGKYRDYSTSGNSRSHNLELKRVVHRDQFGKTQLSGKITYSEVRTYIEEFFIGISSRKAASWSLGLDHSRRWQQGVLSAGITYERGMPWWDATKRISYDEITPTPFYSLWKANSSYYKPFLLSNQTFSWSTQLYAQWAPHTLYNTQRVQIGGQYAVRGFQSQTIRGDRGAYWHNDLNWTLPYQLSGIQQQIFAGYDVGGVLHDWRESQERGWMHGIAWGYKFYHQHFSTQLQSEHGLEGPTHAKPDPWVCRVNLTLSY